MRTSKGKSAKIRLIWLRVRDLRCALHDQGQPLAGLCQRCAYVKQALAAQLLQLTPKQIKEVKL